MRVKIIFLIWACLSCFVPPSTSFSIHIPEKNPCGGTATTEASGGNGCGEGMSQGVQSLKKDVITKVLSLGKTIISGAVNIGASVVAKKLAMLSAPDCPTPCPTTPKPTTTTTTTTPKPTTTTTMPTTTTTTTPKPTTTTTKPTTTTTTTPKPTTTTTKPTTTTTTTPKPTTTTTKPTTTTTKPTTTTEAPTTKKPCHHTPVHGSHEHAHEVAYEYIIYANDDPNSFVQHNPHYDVVCDDSEQVIAYFNK